MASGRMRARRYCRERVDCLRRHLRLVPRCGDWRRQRHDTRRVNRSSELGDDEHALVPACSIREEVVQLLALAVADERGENPLCCFASAAGDRERLDVEGRHRILHSRVRMHPFKDVLVDRHQRCGRRERSTQLIFELLHALNVIGDRRAVGSVGLQVCVEVLGDEPTDRSVRSTQPLSRSLFDVMDAQLGGERDRTIEAPLRFERQSDADGPWLPKVEQRESTASDHATHG